MPQEEKGFRGVSLNTYVISDVEHFIAKNPKYRSISDFVTEAVRIRLDHLKKSQQTGA